jgi:hypothetical protein
MWARTLGTLFMLVSQGGQPRSMSKRICKRLITQDLLRSANGLGAATLPTPHCLLKDNPRLDIPGLTSFLQQHPAKRLRNQVLSYVGSRAAPELPQSH